MPRTLLVTAENLEDLLGVTFSPTETVTAETLLANIQRELEAFTHRALSPITVVGERITVEDGRAFVRWPPVASITSITYSNATLTPFTEVPTVEDGGLGFAGELDATLILSYVGGMPITDERAEQAKALILARASRAMTKVLDDAVGVGQLSQEGYNANYLAEGWTDQELMIARGLKRRTVVT